MRLLLDTHLLLWAVASSRRLPRSARIQIEDTENDVYFSAASMWEIAIKSSLRRIDFRVDPEEIRSALLETGFIELPVTSAHATGVARLPAIHKDPFDRLLVSQSILEPLTLLTNDPVLARYWGGVTVV